MALGYDSTCFSLVYIRENEKLHELCNKLRLLEFVSIDTEFVRVSTFFPKAGLIQLIDGETCYLLDPLELSDWDSFVDLLKNPSVINVLPSC